MSENVAYPVKSRTNWHGRIRAPVNRLTRSRREVAALKERTIDLAAEALEARDLAIARHSQRVAQLAASLAERLALSRQWIGLMRTAGALHDLGMIGIPDEVLNKVGPLSEDEWEVMRRHPDIGADLITQHSALAPLAPLVRHHHEHWDGSGYPAGLKREGIPMGARILAAAESFDTITNPRIYRRDTVSSALAVRDIAQRAGSWYDPSVVNALRKLYG